MRTIELKILPEDKVFLLHNNMVVEAVIQTVLLNPDNNVQALVITIEGNGRNTKSTSKEVFLTKQELLDSL